MMNFLKNVSSNLFVMAFFSIILISFMGRCFIDIGLCLQDIFLILFQTVFSLGENVDFTNTFSPIFFFTSLDILRAFVQCRLYSIKLLVVGSLLNFHTAAFLRLIAFLQSSLNCGLVFLFDVVFLGMNSSAIDIYASVISSVGEVLFSVS